MSTAKPAVGHDHPFLSGLSPTRAKKGKIVSAYEAIQLIGDGDTVATGGFVGIGFRRSAGRGAGRLFPRKRPPPRSDPALRRRPGRRRRARV